MVLAAYGQAALTIDRLCADLGLTKGAFYHHFGSMAGYKTALLEHFEAVNTTRFIDEVESDADAAPTEKLRRLLQLVLADDHDDGGVEVAVRAWAMRDAEVRAIQERVDRTRISYVHSLWCGHEPDSARAEEMAQLLYLVLIGGGHLVPPLRSSELRRMFDLVLQLTNFETGVTT